MVQFTKFMEIWLTKCWVHGLNRAPKLTVILSEASERLFMAEPVKNSHPVRVFFRNTKGFDLWRVKGFLRNDAPIGLFSDCQHTRTGLLVYNRHRFRLLVDESENLRQGGDIPCQRSVICAPEIFLIFFSLINCVTNKEMDNVIQSQYSYSKAQ